jgi:hypothetical protein
MSWALLLALVDCTRPSSPSSSSPMPYPPSVLCYLSGRGWPRALFSTFSCKSMRKLRLVPSLCFSDLLRSQGKMHDNLTFPSIRLSRRFYLPYESPIRGRRRMTLPPPGMSARYGLAAEGNRRTVAKFLHVGIPQVRWTPASLASGSRRRSTCIKIGRHQVLKDPSKSDIPLQSRHIFSLNTPNGSRKLLTRSNRLGLQEPGGTAFLGCGALGWNLWGGVV